MKKDYSLLFFLLFLFLLAPLGTYAAPITFNHSGRGSGTLDGIAFPERDFTITGVGDTENLYSEFSSQIIEHDIAFIEIEGLGSLDFSTLTSTFFQDGDGYGGIAVMRGGGYNPDLFWGPYNSSELDDYDMISSIGPITGNGILRQWDLSSLPPIITNLGVLVFDTDYDIVATFQAKVNTAPVPEPGTLLLLGTGLVGLVGIGRKKFLNKK